MVASKQFGLTVETEEERRARLENDAAKTGEGGRWQTVRVDRGDRRRKKSNDAATKRLRLAVELDEERKARLERW